MCPGQSSERLPSLSPHPAHAGADIDAHALSSRSRRTAGRNTRPTCHVEQAEKAIWDKARPRGIEMAIALGTLAVREETLWYDQMQIVHEQTPYNSQG